MKIVGDINNPEQTAITGYLVKRFMNESWMKELLFGILKTQRDYDAVINWRLEHNNLKLGFLQNIVVIGKSLTMMIYWEEFLALRGDRSVPVKFFRKIAFKL